MPIDPIGKMAKFKAATKIARALKTKPRKPGRLSKVEKSIVAEIVENTDLSIPQVHALAVTLDRPVDTIRAQIESARAELQANAKNYAQAHKKVVDTALESDDPKALEVARRASQWALEKISHKDADGKQTRVIDVETNAASDAPRIQIGIALGGLPLQHKAPGASRE